MNARLWMVLALALTVAVVAGACAPVPRGIGSQPATVELTFANGLDGHTELQALADTVQRASGGSMQISFKDMANRDRPDTEPATLDDVVAGRYDMAWVAQRPWPARGVKAFDALVAPSLIDTYALEGAVLGDPIVDEMLAAVQGSGVVGLGIIPGPIRYAASKDEALLTPGGYGGRTVAIDDTAVGEDAIRALGGTPTAIPPSHTLDGADAVVQQLGSIVGNRYHHEMPFVSGLALWPRPVIVIIGKPRYDSLSDEQRTWLRQGIDAVIADQLRALPNADSDAIGRLCDDGATIASPDAEQIAAFEAAFEPVIDRLDADALTARAVARIRELKAALPLATALTACDVAASSEPPGTTGAGFPDGTYEAPASCEELQAFWQSHETPSDDRIPCPIVLGFTLKDGKWTENYGEQWTYAFFGDHVKLGDFTLRWAYDGTGVTFSDIQGGNPDDASVWTLKQFRRIADAAPSPQVGFPDGTYQMAISAEEMQAWWAANDVPLDERQACPCSGGFTLKDGVWTGSDGSNWDYSFFGDKLTLADQFGSFTLRWSWDGKAVSFSDMVGGGWGERAGFTVKPWVRQ